MQSPAVWSSGFFPSATIRHTMSRSVITPISVPRSSPSTTGISPQSFCTINLATSRSGVDAVQQAGLGVMISFTFMGYLHKGPGIALLWLKQRKYR